MLNVYLNNGNLIIFEKAKATFENGELFVDSNLTLNHNFDYEKDLKEVYKVIKSEHKKFKEYKQSRGL